MLSRTFQVVACVFLIFSVVASASSQTNPTKTPSASISGKITLKNKGVAGVVVFVHEQYSTGPGAASYRGTTDQSGIYRITNVPAGTYMVQPMAPALALADEFSNNSVVVTEGETVENIDFRMVQGGVITGRIMDADGKPLIEEFVTLMPIESRIIRERVGGDLRTDDRGIYRAFGLRAGKYKVSVGHEHSLPSFARRRSYRKTFYPSVTDADKATVVEVTEGSETKDIDIVVGRPLPTFRVSGRIVDAETGKPLPGIRYGVHQNIDENSSHSTVGRVVTNANGEFLVENVLPGKYSVFVVTEESEFRGDSVSFAVVDRDVSDLMIRAARASSLSGVVVFEGAEEKTSTFKRGELYVNAWVESNEAHFDSGFSAPVNPDGTFRSSGLRKGIIHFGFASNVGAAKNMTLVRVERDGIVQPQGITLKDGEQVTGLRLVVKYLTGTIRGQVEVEGELAPEARLSVWLTRLGNTGSSYEPEMGNPSPQLDSRRRFVAEGLAAGTYDVNVSVYDLKRPETSKIFKQQVTVADNAVSEVTVLVKTKP